MKKYIFLDFDGVLNTQYNIKALKEQGQPFSDKYGYCFDATAVANFATIIEHTKAEIIISSSWKIGGLSKMLEMWSERALPGKIIDITPSDVLDAKDIDFSNPDDLVGRGREIEQWIRQNGRAKDRYVILDDLDDLLLSQNPFFIQIDPRIGITAGDVEKAIRILNHDSNEVCRILSPKVVSEVCADMFENAVALACAGQQETAILRMEMLFPVLFQSDIGYEVIDLLGFYCQLCMDTEQYDKAKQIFKKGMELIAEGKRLGLNFDSYEEDINAFLDLKIEIDKLSSIPESQKKN